MRSLPKSIDHEGLGESHTGARQNLTQEAMLAKGNTCFAYAPTKCFLYTVKQIDLGKSYLTLTYILFV